MHSYLGQTQKNNCMNQMLQKDCLVDFVINQLRILFVRDFLNKNISKKFFLFILPYTALLSGTHQNISYFINNQLKSNSLSK